MRKIIYLLVILLLSGQYAYAQKRSTIVKYTTNSQSISAIDFSAQGRVIGIGDGKVVSVFSWNGDQMLRQFTNVHTAEVLTLDISNDSCFLASGGKDSLIVLWDFKSGEVISRLYYHKGVITSVKISADSKYLVSGSSDNKLIIYDIENSKIVNEFSDHQDDICSVDISPDNRLVVTGGGDRCMNIYDVQKAKLIRSYNHYKGWVRDVQFSHDGKKLYSCGDDGHIIVKTIMGNDEFFILSDEKQGFGWKICLAIHDKDGIYASANMNGDISLYTMSGRSELKLRRGVYNMMFQPGEPVYLRLAVATVDDGVILISTTDFQ